MENRNGLVVGARMTQATGIAERRVEEIFGGLKTIGMIRRTRHRGLPRVDWIFTFALAAYNLVRMRNLSAAPA
jgi:hypothetical protein